MRKVRIIMVAYKRVVPLRIAIDSFLLQTNPNWELYLVHDGKTPAEVMEVVRHREDPRIHFFETEKVNGRWGHPNRRSMLQQIDAEPHDLVVITNDDNYYVPFFVQMVLSVVTPKTGIVYYNTLHSYFDYTVHRSELKECWIDMGALAVRADVAKAVGFNHDKSSADGVYAEECAAYCKVKGFDTVYIPNKVPFIHN